MLYDVLRGREVNVKTTTKHFQGTVECAVRSLFVLSSFYCIELSMNSFSQLQVFKMAYYSNTPYLDALFSNKIKHIAI